MAGEVIAGLGAIKIAFDIAKGLKDIHDVAARDRAVIELQKEILAAQQTQSTLVETVSELKKEVARLKDWEADKARYQLSEIAAGMVALAVKDTMRNGEPFHRICANCAANGKKSYLQHHIHGVRFDEFRCNQCKEVLRVHKGPGTVGIVGYGGREPGQEYD
jgi:hypothetical protein